jgi:hypothetical protein
VALVIVAALTIILAADGSSIPPGAQIGFQIHSWNDIREWEAGFAKGMRMFKIDPFFKDPTFCKSQPRAKPNDPRGCFVLNHDPPVPTQTYNTTDDVLNFIMIHQHLFQGEPIKIALCFKESPRIVCADSPPQGKYWKSMIDDFFNTANVLIEKFDLNLEFILDGDATFDHHPCLINKWRPWNMTWIKGPIDAFTTNNVTFGYDRYQIYNSPAVPALVTLEASLNFGKFPGSAYPLQVWEPANQATFEQISNIYLHWAQVFNNSHDFRFAINLDPKMFEFYTARVSGKNIQELIYRVGDYPQVIAVPRDGATDEYVLITFFSVSSRLFYSASVLSYSNYNLPLLNKNVALFPLPLVNLDFPSMKVSWSKGSGTVSMLLSDKSATFNEIVINTQSVNQVSLARNGTLITLDGFNFTVSSTSWLQRNVNSPSIITQVFQTANCDTYLSLWQWNGAEMAPTSFKPVKISSNLCAQEISHSFLTQQDTKLSCDVEGIVTMTSNNNTFGGNLCFYLDDRHTVVKALLNGKPIGDTNRFTFIDVGTRSQVNHLIGKDDQVNTLLTHGDGYCWNTEPRNKRPAPRMCDQVPQSTANVLSYALASFNDWRNIFAGTVEGLPLHPCRITPLTGTWSLGSSQTSASFAKSDGTVGFVSSFRGLPAALADPPDECGRPLSLSDDGGIVLGVLHF